MDFSLLNQAIANLQTAEGAKVTTGGALGTATTNLAAAQNAFNGAEKDDTDAAAAMVAALQALIAAAQSLLPATPPTP